MNLVQAQKDYIFLHIVCFSSSVNALLFEGTPEHLIFLKRDTIIRLQRSHDAVGGGRRIGDKYDNIMRHTGLDYRAAKRSEILRYRKSSVHCHASSWSLRPARQISGFCPPNAISNADKCRPHSPRRGPFYVGSRMKSIS